MRKPPDGPLLKAFAAEIKSRRASLAISQEELAHKADLNRTFVGKLETAESQPSLTVIFQLASALQVEVSDLVDSVSKRADKERKASKRQLKNKQADPVRRV